MFICILTDSTRTSLCSIETGRINLILSSHAFEFDRNWVIGTAIRCMIKASIYPHTLLKIKDRASRSCACINRRRTRRSLAQVLSTSGGTRATIAVNKCPKTERYPAVEYAYNISIRSSDGKNTLYRRSITPLPVRIYQGHLRNYSLGRLLTDAQVAKYSRGTVSPYLPGISIWPSHKKCLLCTIY
ncbi:uncharacterized protein EI90DRAFT_2567520 [Cantharellus anzutake]|uniref:uncharacterized protein n=1 Tax=Cantharellus anzutake TaxID=1750568 RepID=UPI001902FD0C|nr:uncharacterized protein EI90DRAFT_2567520 [Cantharellus anzutake]KAF8338265.1 hypothetical protein EI90DRAFT_2567520 [Cantharellus anzutake]